MSYINANTVLPQAIIELIQDYIEGDTIYIPKKEECKKAWGENTNTKHELNNRNAQIYADYKKGMKTSELATKYYLSIKSIQRIVLASKKTA
jgi:Mor family transcriptional regulator